VLARRLQAISVVTAAIALAAIACGRLPADARGAAGGAGVLNHLIFIVQENRSFDHYFGTFPGADGFPSPLPCLPDEWYPSQCDMPYLNHEDGNIGGGHNRVWQVANIDGGKMDGFVVSREKQLGNHCKPPNEGRVLGGTWIDDEGFPHVAACTIDVMGYHDGTDLPNYWAYASTYVLEDQFFEGDTSWSEPNHFNIFSGWAAKCTEQNPPNVNSCASTYGGDVWGPRYTTPDLWTDITYLLNQNNVSWNVYLDGGQGKPFDQKHVPGIWSVLPGFETVQDDNQVGNAEVNLTQFYVDAANGGLPQVTWVLPKYFDSEHPQARISDGQTYVTGLINAVMSGPDWSDSAIFVTYDDSDGFYDHVPPPVAFDSLGVGIRLPAWIVSPYAKTGYIDHQFCSSDCYLKFIEDTFLNGERMNQAGRPDPRPDYRDTQPAYGDLTNDFDFSQNPRAPLILPLHPMTLLREGAAPAPRRIERANVR
jgi:phospholipase C